MNKVLLTGRVGKDPELKYTPKSTAVANFSLTVKRGEGEAYFRCVAWEEKAERIAKEFKKGTLVFVDGFLNNRSWVDRDDKRHWITEIVVNFYEVLAAPVKEEPEEKYFDEDPEEGPF